MADWHVIDNTGRTLVAILQQRFQQLGLLNVTVGVVTTASFTTLATTADPFVSLFLYQITGNPELRNLPQPVRPDGSRRRQSLPLELCYLTTAWGVRNPDDVASDSLAAQEETQLLGIVLQTFYDDAELGRGDLFESAAVPVWAPHDGLQIVMETLPVDAHYRIWDAAELGYHLSLVYRVRVASLEPSLMPPAPPVSEAALEIS
jgi:Pvc16 N-terminal domain